MQKSNEETESKPDTGINSTRICRFCLSPAGVMSPIFEDGEVNSLPLTSKIMAFVSIQVYVNDGLPTLICHRCLYQVEKSYDFKTQCEASDAMLRKYLSAVQSSRSGKGASTDNCDSFVPTFDTYTLTQFQKSLHATTSDSPFKRKRGRPRKEENMMFYNSSHQGQSEFSNGVSGYADESEIKIVDGIESVVTVVDPRSEILSNSDDENKAENENVSLGYENRNEIIYNEETLESLAIAKAKAKIYMGVMVGVDENGTTTRRHLCKGCGKTFGHCSDLRKHVLVHTGERPFHCRICTKTFSRSTNLNKHMKVHMGQKPFSCTDCPKSFATKGDLQRHLVIHSGVKPFACHLCNQCFSRKDKLTRHYKLHENGALTKMPFKCEFCPGTFQSKSELDFHSETFHLTSAKMEDEDAEAEDEEEVEEKRLRECEGKEEEDEEDEEKGERWGEKKVQESKKDDSLEESGTSPEVESMVINIDPFQMDSDLNDVANSWEEDKVKRKAKEETLDLSYETEEKKRGGKDSYEKLECKVCFKKFNEAAYLRSHMATHATVKPHKCDRCEKSFTRKRELVRHENVHLGYKPFPCHICGKAFSRKDKLARHLKIHNGVKKFPCTLCPSLSFAKVDDLLYHHGLVHSETESPHLATLEAQSKTRYQCETCFVCYSDLRRYRDHLKVHDPPKKLNGTHGESENECSDDDRLASDSLEQLNSNPAITVTSVSKSR